jgi:vacuolar-type H+-ATPase subunit H
MKEHNENSNEKEAQFSQNLEALKGAENEAKKDIQNAMKRKESIIAQGKEDAAKMLEDSGEGLEEEKERIIEKGIKKIEEEVADIIDKAEKEAQRVRKSASPEKIVDKLLITVMSKD